MPRKWKSLAVAAIALSAAGCNQDEAPRGTSLKSAIVLGVYNLGDDSHQVPCNGIQTGGGRICGDRGWFVNIKAFFKHHRTGWELVRARHKYGH